MIIKKVNKGVDVYGPNQITVRQGENHFTQKEYEELRSYRLYKKKTDSKDYLFVLSVIEKKESPKEKESSKEIEKDKPENVDVEIDLSEKKKSRFGKKDKE